MPCSPHSIRSICCPGPLDAANVLKTYLCSFTCLSVCLSVLPFTSPFSSPAPHTQDADRVGAEFLGMAVIPVKDILGGQLYDQWLDLVDKTGAPVGCPDKATKGPAQSRLHISIQYRPVGVKVGSH